MDRRAFVSGVTLALLAAPLAAGGSATTTRNIAQNPATEVLYARIQHALAA